MSNTFFFGATAPRGPGPPHSWGGPWGSTTVGRKSSGRVISSSQRHLPDNTQNSQQTEMHDPGGIRIHNFSRRAASDVPLKPRGHWDRPNTFINFKYFNMSSWLLSSSGLCNFNIVKPRSHLLGRVVFNYLLLSILIKSWWLLIKTILYSKK